jgi:hypothetical protein
MGTSIVLKNADFSESGFKENQIILNYWDGTITPQGFPVAVAGTYKASILKKTLGKSFNYVKLRCGAFEPINLVIYNSTAKTVTKIGTLTPNRLAVAELKFDTKINLGDDEYLGFSKDVDAASLWGYLYSTDQGEGKTFDYIYENGEMANATSWLYKQPMILVEMLYD